MIISIMDVVVRANQNKKMEWLQPLFNGIKIGDRMGINT